MLIVAYDFEDDKKRAKFVRFLEKYGHRIQYSVFQIRDSKRVLQNILTEVELKYKKSFSGADSIVIFHVCEGCKKQVRRYGYAKREESDLIVIS
jgi:CRISPR-associated protein Cas2